MVVLAPVPSSARRFDGTVSVVTGAGGGIGSAIAERLAAEGSHVIACDVGAAAAEDVAVEEEAWLAQGRVPGAGTRFESMARDALLDLRRLTSPAGALSAGAGES